MGKKTKDKQKSKPKKVKGKKKPEKPFDLKSAVLALGGDEEDLDLVQNVEEEEGDEGQEIGGGKEKDFSEKAREELAAFIKKLGLDTKMPKVEDEDDEEEVEEDSEEEEGEEKELQNEQVSSTTKEQSDNEEEEEEEVEHPNMENQRPEFHFVKQKVTHHQCIVKSGQKWFQIVDANEEEENEEEQKEQSKFKYWIPKLEKYATSALENEIENYKKQRKNSVKKNSDAAWIDTVIKSGALNDKISAYTVLLQESPVHNLSVMESLISMVSLKSRRPCMLALDAIKEVFKNDLLAPERKLKSFSEHPFHQLNELSGGNKVTRDRYLIVWMFEHKLKELFAKFFAALEEISKDKIASTKVKVMSVIFELLVSNPEKEHELLAHLVYKLGDPTRTLAAKAMYYLSKLLHHHPAMKLVVVKEVERILYQSHVSPKAQYYGICFLIQIVLDDEEDGDLANRLIDIYFSFFKANIKKGDIDTKLMTALLTGVNRAFPFARIARDKLDSQIQIVFKLVHMGTFSTSIQALMLIFQVMDGGDSATDRFYSALYKKMLHPDLGSSSKQALFLNLLYKAMKKDPQVNRVKAFIKRLVQISQFEPPQLVCGILFLISEVIKHRSDLGSINQILKSSSKMGQILSKFDDEDEEHYEDVKDETESPSEDPEDPKPSTSASWVHKSNLTKTSSTHKSTIAEYDPFQRNPSYSGAECSLLWEMHSLATHFHPSVALFAQNLLTEKEIKYTGDPLQDFTLMRFLDRFVFRNPKKDPLKGRPVTVHSKRNLYLPKGIKALAPDSKEYVNHDEAVIPKDELFIYKYFKDRKAKKTDEQDSDAESVTSEDFNNFMDRLGGGDGGADKDLDFSSSMSQLKDLESDEDDDEIEGGNDSEEPDLDSDEPELEGDEGESDLEFENLEDMNDSEDEFDEENFEISDDEEEELPKKKSQKKVDKKTKKGKGDLNSLLASAEEFADMVEEAALDDIDIGGSKSVSNVKDKASKKQLVWEEKQREGNEWKKRKRKMTSGGQHKGKKWKGKR